MKWMIASDIHGSEYYCNELLEAYQREKADRLLLLGDILYHGPRNDLPKEYQPKKVIEQLNAYKQDIICVRGNHSFLVHPAKRMSLSVSLPPFSATSFVSEYEFASTAEFSTALLLFVLFLLLHDKRVAKHANSNNLFISNYLIMISCR